MASWLVDEHSTGSYGVICHDRSRKSSQKSGCRWILSLLVFQTLEEWTNNQVKWHGFIPLEPIGRFTFVLYWVYWADRGQAASFEKPHVGGVHCDCRRIRRCQTFTLSTGDFEQSFCSVWANRPGDWIDVLHSPAFLFRSLRHKIHKGCYWQLACTKFIDKSTTKETHVFNHIEHAKSFGLDTNSSC